MDVTHKEAKEQSQGIGFRTPSFQNLRMLQPLYQTVVFGSENVVIFRDLAWSLTLKREIWTKIYLWFINPPIYFPAPPEHFKSSRHPNAYYFKCCINNHYVVLVMKNSKDYMPDVFSLQLIESKDPELDAWRLTILPLGILGEGETIYWIIILSTTDGSQRWSGMERGKNTTLNKMQNCPCSF